MALGQLEIHMQIKENLVNSHYMNAFVGLNMKDKSINIFNKNKMNFFLEHEIEKDELNQVQKSIMH